MKKGGPADVCQVSPRTLCLLVVAVGDSRKPATPARASGYPTIPNPASHSQQRGQSSSKGFCLLKDLRVFPYFPFVKDAEYRQFVDDVIT
jgi:hypothetical protein